MFNVLITDRHKIVFDGAGQMALHHDKSDYEIVIGPWCKAVKEPEQIATIRPDDHKDVLVFTYRDGLKVDVKIGRETMELTPFRQAGSKKWRGG